MPEKYELSLGLHVRGSSAITAISNTYNNLAVVIELVEDFLVQFGKPDAGDQIITIRVRSVSIEE